MKELAQDGHAQVAAASCQLNVAAVSLRLVLRPTAPRRRDAVEERLDQRGLEEVLAAVARGTSCPAILPGPAGSGQRGQVAALDAAGVAGVGGQEPGQVLGVGQGRVVLHGPLR